MSENIRPTCSNCGSTNLVLNILASWIVLEERTKIHDIYNEGHFCNDCKNSCTIKWVRLN